MKNLILVVKMDAFRCLTNILSFESYCSLFYPRIKAETGLLIVYFFCIQILECNIIVLHGIQVIVP